MYPLRVGSELIARGWKVCGISLKETRIAAEMKARGFDVYEVTSRGSAIFKIYSLISWIKKQKIDVIHCHKSGDLFLGAVIKHVARQDLKLIFTEHMGANRPKKDLFHRWVYYHVDWVLSISDETRSRNIAALPVPEPRIKRLWLGTEVVNCNDSVAMIRQEFSIPPDAIVLGILGRIDSGKGQKELLGAYLELKKNYPGLYFLIVGGLNAQEGSDEMLVTQLKQVVTNHNLEDYVIFTGFRKDTARMLKAMDIVAFPSHNEAFGLTVIEAMMAGKAIVGADTGAIPEVLADTGLLANPKSSLELATKIALFVESEIMRNKFSGKAQGRAREHFSMNRHIALLTEFYEIMV